MGSITSHIYDLLNEGGNYEEPRPRYTGLPNFFEAVDAGAVLQAHGEGRSEREDKTDGNATEESNLNTAK
jgi:hypothetical protein